MTRLLSLRRGRHAAPRRRAVQVVVWLALACAASLLVQLHVAAVFYVPSASMEPTLHGCAGCADDRVLVNRLSYLGSGPDRGDVVVFTTPASWSTGPDDGGRQLVKRVVALAGDTVAGVDGVLVVNGREAVEPYLPASSVTGPFAEVTVPAGAVWVLGDNRDNSADSREHGPVPVDSVVGQVVARVWPVDRIGSLDS